MRGYQARWFENYVAVPGARATGPWNRRSVEDAENRELFEECVTIIKTAWTRDTFSFRDRDRYRKTLELCAEKVIPRFR